MHQFNFTEVQKDQRVCAVGGLVPAREGELDLAVVHLGDQGTSALAGGHHLAPDDLGQQVNISSLSKFGSPG